MVRYGGASAFLGILSLIALSIFLSLFSGMAGIFIGKAIHKKPLPFILLPLIWVSRDWVIEKIFGGFPWCLAGYSQFKHLFFIQWAEWGGIHLITFLLVYFNVLIYIMIRERSPKYLMTILASLFLIDSVGFGLMTAQQRRMKPITVSQAGIIQPNITHDRTFDFQSISTELKRLFQISESLQRKGAEFVIWPEYTIPIYPRQTPFYLNQFDRSFRPPDPHFGRFYRLPESEQRVQRHVPF